MSRPPDPAMGFSGSIAWAWRTVVGPLLDAASPSVIVEIGAARGENTRKLVEWASAAGAVVHSIDPVPEFDTEELAGEHPGTLIFHRERSLSALPAIDEIDAVVIDGDHNWYTVINELRLLDEASPDGRFPLAVIHDVGWPYGRRDLYYDPDSIPDAYRQAHRQGGVAPGTAELTPGRGLNPDLEHAVYEGNAKNGVLTAVEDFLEETDTSLTLQMIPGGHGLGILAADQDLEESDQLSELLEQFRSAEFLRLHAAQLEEERVLGLLDTQAARDQADAGRMEGEERVRALEAQAERRESEQRRRMDDLRSELRDVQGALQSKNYEIAGLRALEERLDEKDTEIERLRQLNLEQAIRGEALTTATDQLATVTEALVAINFKRGPWRSKLKRGSQLASWVIRRRGDGLRDARTYFALKRSGAFDPAFYRGTYLDIATSGADPLLHYIEHGAREGRNPSPLFDTSAYTEQHPELLEEGTNPLLHSIEHGQHSQVPPPPQSNREDEPEEIPVGDAAPGELLADVRRSVQPGEHFEEFDPTISAGRDRRARVLAFYLPQFHSIPENDRWWGPGFTEWRNVVRGMPRFAGHLQPRVPRDLGFYDLSDVGVMRRQAELAEAAGLSGFAFYYYSFGGKRLLEQPVEQYLADGSIDFPFCLVWANENWTRRWDGGGHEILMEQDHDQANDETLVDDFQRHFEDGRYIRIGGRPLLLVYHLEAIPSARELLGRWRSLWETRHGERPLILAVQSIRETDPREFGVDGAVEFPPQQLGGHENRVGGQLRFYEPSVAPWILDYERVAQSAVEKKRPSYPWVRGVAPSWDNDARRQGRGAILHGSTPSAYEGWLSAAVEFARAHPVHGESLVFVNAWNEWAEGAYLEPDVHHGAAYLNATARAVCGAPGAPAKNKILLIGHDAHPHGAQMTLRALGSCLADRFGCEVAYLLLEGGALTADYESAGRIRVAGDTREIEDALREFAAKGFRQAITNTVVTGEVVPRLKDAGYRVVSLVHELPGVIQDRDLEPAAQAIVDRSDRIVFPAKMVADRFAEIARPRDEAVAIRSQGVYREASLSPAGPDADVRSELGISAESRIVLNLGFAEKRKGADIFHRMAELATSSAPDLHFVWVGHIAPEVETLRSEAQVRVNLHVAPFADDPSRYLAAADVFFLSSREDSFPTVVLEALAAGLPIVALQGATGCEELISEHGRVVSPDQPHGILEALVECAEEQDPSAAEARRETIKTHHRFEDYSFELIRLLDPGLKKVSVVVPNYNYGEYLPARMATIFEQTYPVFEVIVIDDGSTDDSLETLERIRESTGRQFQVIASEVNSKSPIAQWMKACQVARGDYLWIAESDDMCRPNFLERLIDQLDDRMAFAFSDSATIDENGDPIGDSYKFYFREAVGDLMENDFVRDGESFVRECLTERNLVLNGSAVVWNRTCLDETIRDERDALSTYKLAFDWDLYAAASMRGRQVAYVADPVNINRRHPRGVTNSLSKEEHLAEVKRVHQRILRWLGPDDGLLDRMTRYESRLAAQFGINGSQDG
jgi:glycosyltransferase involved in cell wall biosynthesis